MPPVEYLHASVRGKLSALRTALRGRLVGEGAAWAVVGLVGLVFVTLGFDYLLRLERPLRGLIMGAAVIAVLWILWRELIRPLCVPMDSAGLALLVEKRFGQLGDRLISAIQFTDRGSVESLGMSDAMVAAMAVEANRIADSLNFREVVERRTLRRTGLAALCAALVLGGFTAWQLPIMELWFQRNVAFAAVDWPQDTYLQVLGGPDFKVLRGDDLEVAVAVREGSVIPRYVTLHAEYASYGRTEDRIDPDPRRAGRFVCAFRNVSEEFVFYVTGGDDKQDKRRKHRVLLVDAPALRDASFRLEPPAYMKRPPRTLDGGAGMLSVGAGWWVRVTGVATKDLQKAQMRLESESTQELGEYCEKLRSAVRQHLSDRSQLDAVAKQLAEGRIKPEDVPLARLARQQSALADLTGRFAKSVQRILDGIAGNPPPRGSFTPGRVAGEILVPLHTVSAESKGLAGLLAAKEGEGPAELAARLREVSATRGKLLDALGAVLDRTETMRAWMERIEMHVSASGPGGQGSPRDVRGSFYIWGQSRSEPMTLSILMTDTEGLTNRRGAQYLIQVNPDTAPTVDAAKRGVGATITPNAIIPLRLHAKDDCGLSGGRIVCRVDPVGESKQAGVALKEVEYGGLEYISPRTDPLDPNRMKWDTVDLQETNEFKDLGGAPGDLLRIVVEMGDNLPKEFRGPNIGTSAHLDFRVVKPEDLMDDLIRRQKALRLEFAQAVDLQEAARAKTLGAVERIGSEQVPPDVRRLLSDSGKLQISVGAECTKAADTLRAIMEEMANNRLGKEKVFEENLANVIQPLEQLAEDIPAVAASLEGTSSMTDSGKLRTMVGKIAELQENLRMVMERILAHIYEGLTRQEVDKELQRIIGISQQLLKEIQHLADKQVGQQFDPEKNSSNP